MTAVAELARANFTGEIHPLADVFPLLDDDELQALADDIAANGQEFPILLDALGRLVDGRNRLRAAEMAGHEPWFEQDVCLTTDAAVARVVGSRNNRRRHQKPGQVAAADALLLAAQGLRQNGRWARGSVDTGSSSTSEIKAIWLDVYGSIPAALSAGAIDLVEPGAAS